VKDARKKLEGLGGWLIVAGLGIIVTPLRIGALITEAPKEIFSAGTLAAVTASGSGTYNALWVIMLLELLSNAGLALAIVYLLYLFFFKKTRFPQWYIGIALFSLYFIIIDAWAIQLFLPAEPVLDIDIFKDFTRTLAIAAIGVPYVLVSKRVKATFTH
jgi:hypothetical protein